MRRCLYSILVILLCVVGLSGQPVQARTQLNKTKLTISVGQKVTLKVKGNHKKAKWSSSNKKVATVNQKGKVRAKRAGKTTIMAKVGKKKYRCKITVISIIIPTDGELIEKTTEATTEKMTQTSTEKTTETTTEKTTEQGQNTVEKPSDEKNNTSATPSGDTKNQDAGEYSLDQVHTGEGTYYDRESGGAANIDYMEDTYYTAAMNHEDYMNGLAGAYIEITDKDGDKINVVITDRLPEGKKGDIDLTTKTFQQIEPLATGRMDITWKIVPLPTTEPIQYVFKPTSSQYWAEVQVRNHRYPIKKLEYFDTATNAYVELPRQEYNYFTAVSGMGTGPFTFRVTDFYGHVLVDTGISMNTTGTPVNGKANFPY
ncbi:MAG: expansin EXLX1 family cellulose-binding protein [Lachnospiraceae bacterium]|nr:expansin EXLX1 family cellulose-binding protein [Lachnospiraceae bacterium]